MVITIVKLSDTNKDEFIARLTKELTFKFGENVDNWPDNYGGKKYWGLMSLINENKLADYWLLYTDNNFWTGSGGRVRNHNGEKIYQAAFRGFSCATKSYQGLGMKSLLHLYITPQQIENAKALECAKVIMSFNPHNYRLFKATHKYFLPKAIPNVDWQASSEAVMFNGLPQWLIIHDLKKP